MPKKYPRGDQKRLDEEALKDAKWEAKKKDLLNPKGRTAEVVMLYAQKAQYRIVFKQDGKYKGKNEILKDGERFIGYHIKRWVAYGYIGISRDGRGRPLSRAK
jgi:hypothetical protein